MKRIEESMEGGVSEVKERVEGERRGMEEGEGKFDRELGFIGKEGREERGDGEEEGG